MGIKKKNQKRQKKKQFKIMNIVQLYSSNI